MKKLLGVLFTITLIITTTVSLFVYNILSYNTAELKEIENNKMNIKENILEWIAPQEKPFNNVDNKYYFVVWHGKEKGDWIISKFKNNLSGYKKIDNFDNYKLFKTNLGNLYIQKESGFVKNAFQWNNGNGVYFKSVYRWNSENNVPDLVVYFDTGKIEVNK